MRQAQALTVMTSGANVFLTGAPGAGKTYVLQQFIKNAEARGKRVAVTASTGIAASHISGTTIHSWSGLGILDVLSQHDLDRLAVNERLVKRYNSTDILVIDEVSMLHGYRLDMINALAKVLRASEKPFGGIQVILVGDLFQLPPITRGGGQESFAHSSEAWEELDLQVCYLTEQHRQAQNDGLLDLLEAMRRNEVDDHHLELLQQRLDATAEEPESITRLYAHNMDVDSINKRQLAKIDNEERTFVMLTKGSKAKIEQVKKSLLAPEELTLKVGAEVMFVANNFSSGFVNGSRGTVVGFSGGLPTVQLQTGRTINVELHTWTLTEDGKSRAEISQLPLRLAWAITIHKSQGMSLDAATVDLSRAFTPGMGYVALSRVRSLDGLHLKGINQMALTMHPAMHDFDFKIRIASGKLAETTEDFEEKIVAPEDIQPSQIDQDLLEELKDWRLMRCKKDGIAPFMVAHNTTLEALATSKPETAQQLLGVSGFGPKKVQLYGDDIISIVERFLN